MFSRKDFQAAGQAAALAATRSLADSELAWRNRSYSADYAGTADRKKTMGNQRTATMVLVLGSCAPVSARRDWYRSGKHPKKAPGPVNRLFLTH